MLFHWSLVIAKDVGNHLFHLLGILPSGFKEHFDSLLRCHLFQYGLILIFTVILLLLIWGSSVSDYIYIVCVRCFVVWKDQRRLWGWLDTYLIWFVCRVIIYLMWELSIRFEPVERFSLSQALPNYCYTLIIFWLIIDVWDWFQIKVV